MTLESMIKKNYLWIIIVYGLLEQPRVGVKLSSLGNLKKSKMTTKMAFAEKLY